MIRFSSSGSGSLRCVTPGRRFIVAALIAPPLLTLAACGPRQAPGNDANASNPQEVTGNAVTTGNGGLPGTPMAQRVAEIRILNKRNGITRMLKMKPGQAFRVDNAIVRLRACEQTAPWEEVPETGAFVQLDVRESRDNQWHRVFSGWLFKERPDRNVVQHPIYDVWVMSCAMSWPETGTDTVKVAGKAGLEGGGNESGGNESASSAVQSAGSPPPGASAASNSAE
jgi:hypothetical protein